MAMDTKKDAKHPATPIAGPYGHPFHPILVTVPIGCWLASLVFDIASHFSFEGQYLSRAAFWLIGLGCVGAVLAALFGMMDYSTIPRHTRAKKTGLIHAGLNTAVLALFAISFLLRRGEAYAFDKATDLGLIMLSVVATVLLGASGWLGGKLAYRYGVRVADERTQAEGFKGPMRPTEA